VACEMFDYIFFKCIAGGESLIFCGVLIVDDRESCPSF
jgi:hypothetical protein